MTGAELLALVAIVLLALAAASPLARRYDAREDARRRNQARPWARRGRRRPSEVDTGEYSDD